MLAEVPKQEDEQALPGVQDLLERMTSAFGGMREQRASTSIVHRSAPRRRHLVKSQWVWRRSSARTLAAEPRRERP
jgi:hypothetical protein